jgi:sugar phosphate isomerase/epimerase
MGAGVPAGTVLLGTVALEPNRWSTVDPSGVPVADLAAIAPRIAATGCDGLELWERHLPDDLSAAVTLLTELPPVMVFNSYVGFDRDDPAALADVAAQVRTTGARAMKFNVGADPALEDAYAERVAALVELLPDDVVLLCECHERISIAEDPAVAARILSAAGPPERVAAIVHTHESADHLRARFDGYGDRIRHVHVNHLDPTTAAAPPLAAVADDLARTVDLLRTLGFDGSWTLEFVEGVLTDHDEPAALVAQAAEDLGVLRSVLAG